MNTSMDDRFHQENIGCDCRPVPPPPPCTRIPVIVERILKPYFNPDGTPSGRKYYQYPVTNFEAVHVGDDIHSPNLHDVTRRIDERICRRQKLLAAGDPNTILTRGRDDGQVGELTKTDYLDDSRRSKTYIGSEYALMKALDGQIVKYQNLVEKETVRATAAEDHIADQVQTEVGRAKDAEANLYNEITHLADTKLNQDFAGHGESILKNFQLNADDLHDVRWSKVLLNPETGNTERINGKIDLLTPIEAMMDKKLEIIPGLDEKIDKSIFDNTDHSLVAKQEFVPGTGNGLGRFETTVKTVDGSAPDVKKVVSYKSDQIKAETREISSTETEVILTIPFATDEMVRNMLAAVYN